MNKNSPKLQVEMIDINALIPYENNAKLHPQEQIDQIANSIKEFGNNDPIAVDEHNVIIEGHGRLLALQQLGYEEVEIIRLSHLTEEQRKAYTLAHNKLTMNSGFDMDLLIEELREIENINMDDLGFADIEIGKLPEITDDEYDLPDDIDERTSTIKQGDIYQLGNHVLMCGDSTSIEDVEKLMGGDHANLVITDPPYNVDYEGQKGMKIQNDSMSDSQFVKFLTDTFAAMKHTLVEGGAFSGKDPSKVDRSGAYIARKIAKEIIRKDWCYKCEIQIGYAIGVAEPVSVYVDTFGTETVPVEQIEAFVATFDLRPQEVIDQLDLLNVDYNKVSAYGHFMNDKMPWEM